jgi:hypothetical protein
MLVALAKGVAAGGRGKRSGIHRNSKKAVPRRSWPSAACRSKSCFQIFLVVVESNGPVLQRRHGVRLGRTFSAIKYRQGTLAHLTVLAFLHESAIRDTVKN